MLGVRKRVWLFVVAMAIAGLAVVGGLRFASDAGDTPREAAAPVASAPPGEADARPIASRPESEAGEPPRATVSPAARRPRRVARAPAPREEDAPGTSQPPFEFGPPGEVTGIALFPPLGSDPPKRGILVPDDFVLPEGYVRHHQATDDGERVPAILMFHPDYVWLDERGEAIALPPDLVVPPELAPPGMPIQMLELPEPGEAR